MKSELVFSANRSVANRYLLCRIAARTVRALHFASSNTQDAITDAFVRIGSQDGVEHGRYGGIGSKVQTGQRSTDFERR